MVLAVTLVAGDGAVLRGEPAEAEIPLAGLEIDLEKEEIRIPCRFVNPSRVLEVFACHRQGPTHETVVEFDVTGPELYQALLELGCRPGSSWNITSPSDFTQTQGDRLLVSVRWKHGDRIREFPAEGMLHDGEFGFPAWVRGFSFDARSPKPIRDTAPGAADPGGGDSAIPEVPEIPEVVEVTLGGTRRQSPSYSLLRHPTTSARLERWMLTPAVNPEVVEDLPELVERQVPAVLILRRLHSERELITHLRSVAARRGVEERLPVYDRLEPIAAEIDGLKSELRTLAARLERLIGDPEPRDADSAKRTVGLLRDGRLLVERIEAAYLRMYEIQEDYKLRWMRRRPEIPTELVEVATINVEGGLRFEPLLASKRVELARLDRERVPAEDFVRRRVVKEMAILEKTRDARIAGANVRYFERRLAALEEDDDYLREMFENDRYKAEVMRRLLEAERSLLESEVDELRARSEKTWETVKPKVAARQKVARQEVAIARLERKLADILYELRWEKNDLESRVEERRARAEEALEKLTREKKAVEAEIAAARAVLRRLKGG